MFDRIAQLAADFVHLFRFFYVLHAYERGVLLRLGVFERELGPGLHWIFPFRIDEVLSAPVTARTTNLPAQVVVTADGKTVAVKALVTWRVRNISKFLLEASEPAEALPDAALGAVAELVAGVTWEDLRGPELARTLRSEVRRRARKYGVTVDAVQLTDVAPARVLRLVQG